MDWWAPGWEAVGRRLESGFTAATWPEAPPPFTPLARARPMRAVVGGRPEGAPSAVVVKWSRPVTRGDRLRRRLSGGKGPREGRLLVRLAAAGLPVPRALGWTDEGADLLATEAVEGLRPLPPWRDAPPRLAARVGDLLGRAVAVGLEHRDLTGKNLGLVGEDPWLVDVGGARVDRATRVSAVRLRARLLRTLARARHAVFGEASRTQRLRALLACLVAAEGGAPRSRWAPLAVEVERRARQVARAYRRRRDRRATRSGLHYEVFTPPGGGRAVRRRETPEAWRALAGTIAAADPADARALKGDGRVVLARLPGTDPVVLKRWRPVLRGRTPRSIRTFRLAVALDHRGVAVPRALLAVSGPDRAGVLVSEHVDAPDLHRFANATDGPGLDGLSPGERRALARALGRFLRRLHDADVRHRDLKAPNLLVRAGSGATPAFWVTDLDGARVVRRGVGWRRRARDLARLDASLAAGSTDRARVLRAYLGLHPRLDVDRRRFVARIRRFVEHKRGPSGRPR